MGKIIKDAIILTVITLVSGCLLGLVYEITKEPIAKAQYDAQQQAYRNVFAEAESFEDLESFPAEGVTSEDGANTINGVVTAMDGAGNVLGYVVTTTSHAGYGGDITLSVGITSDGTVNGYSITTISETAGLGMKSKEEKFSSQFNGKTAESFSVVKGSAASEEQIEAISGATITSNAVTNAVNESLAYFRTINEGGGANE